MATGIMSLNLFYKLSEKVLLLAQFTSVCACAKKMASAELGVVRLGVSGFDKEFAD